MHGWWAASYIVLWLAVISLGVLVVALARQIGTLHLRLGPRGALEMDDEGPALGQMVPAFDLMDTSSKTVRIGGAGHRQLLLFVSPGCHVCEQVLPSVNALAKDPNVRTYVLTDLDQEETALTFGARRLPAPVIAALPVAQSLDVPGTPYIVILDETGVVRAKGTVNNLEQMEGLVDSAMKRMDLEPVPAAAV